MTPLPVLPPVRPSRRTARRRAGRPARRGPPARPRRRAGRPGPSPERRRPGPGRTSMPSGTAPRRTIPSLERQSGDVALSPLEVGPDPAGDGEHAVVEVDADHPAVAPTRSATVRARSRCRRRRRAPPAPAGPGRRRPGAAPTRRRSPARTSPRTAPPPRPRPGSPPWSSWRTPSRESESDPPTIAPARSPRHGCVHPWSRPIPAAGPGSAGPARWDAPRRGGSRPVACVPDSLVAEGRTALERGDWAAARPLFAAALEREDTPDACYGLAQAEEWAGDSRRRPALRARLRRLPGARRDPPARADRRP